MAAAAWKTKPSQYIVSNRDCIIQPGQEVTMAKNIGIKVTALQASHVPQKSQPAKMAEVILEAINNSN